MLFSQAQVQGVSCKDNLSVFRDRINSIRHLEVSALLCWGILPRDTWEAYPKEGFWRSERDVCLEVSLPTKLLFVQTVQGHPPTDPPPPTEIPGGLPAPSSRVPTMILFC